MCEARYRLSRASSASSRLWSRSVGTWIEGSTPRTSVLVKRHPSARQPPRAIDNRSYLVHQASPSASEVSDGFVLCDHLPSSAQDDLTLSSISSSVLCQGMSSDFRQVGLV